MYLNTHFSVLYKFRVTYTLEFLTTSVVPRGLQKVMVAMCISTYVIRHGFCIQNTTLRIMLPISITIQDI